MFEAMILTYSAKLFDNYTAAPWFRLVFVLIYWQTITISLLTGKWTLIVAYIDFHALAK